MKTSSVVSLLSALLLVGTTHGAHLRFKGSAPVFSRHLREECDSDAETDTCLKNTACVQGQCRSPPGSSCSEHGDCTSLYCGNNGLCATLGIDDKIECSSNSDCNGGLICGHGRCRGDTGATCYVPYDCATLTCDSFQQTCEALQVCQEGSAETFECPVGYQCQGRDGAYRKHCRLPVGSSCQNNDDCVTDSNCNSGVCAQIEPLQNRGNDCQLPYNNKNGPNYVQAQCPVGQVCWTHTCDPRTNSCNGNCGRNRGELCTENGDCADGICNILSRMCYR
ncbi:expressed unknown protein [Seminavis robusta]|uniref:Uncharacterized protein n=1 Tax=Seminavis robusta TaxID=568900 RepID=A0A9N8DIE2_9STRA|nr:expressed unknown protein [Seminavis robusta]|eukprot:Sro105_g053170.1 n/a (279) ;mRNA; f:34857-35693